MATVDEVYDVVKGIDKNVDDLVEWKAGMEATCKAHRKETNGIIETLYGNPGGIKGKVDKMWEWRGIWMYVLKVVAAAGTLGLAAWILNAIFGGN